jgi:hypothetical protein
MFLESHNLNKSTICCLIDYFCETGTLDDKKQSSWSSLLTNEMLEMFVCI